MSIAGQGKAVWESAMAAALHNSTERLRTAAGDLLQYARDTGEPQEFLKCSDLFAAAADLPGARHALLEARKVVPVERQQPLVRRMHGLQVQESMGLDAEWLVVSLGRSMAATMSGDEQAQQRLTSLLQLLQKLGVLTPEQTRDPNWEAISGMPELVDAAFGDLLHELLKAAVLSALGDGAELAQSGWKAIPHLARLAPEHAAVLQGQTALPLDLANSILGRPWPNIGQWFTLLGDETDIREFLEVRPRFAEARFRLAQARYAQKDYPAALGELVRLLQVLPRHADGWVLRGEVLLEEEGNATRALECFERALETNPWHGDAVVARARVLCRLGQVEEGVREIRAAATLLPAHQRARALYVAGAALLDQDNVAEAVECLQQSVQCEPARAEAHVQLGTALQKLKRYPEALQHLSKGLELNPRLVNALLCRGQVHSSLGRFGDARSDFELVLRVATPGSPLGKAAAQALSEVPKPDGLFGRLFGSS